MTLKKNKFIKFALCAAVALLTADFSAASSPTPSQNKSPAFEEGTKSPNPSSALEKMPEKDFLSSLAKQRRDLKTLQKHLAQQEEKISNEIDAQRILKAGEGYAETQKNAPSMAQALAKAAEFRYNAPPFIAEAETEANVLIQKYSELRKHKKEAEEKWRQAKAELEAGEKNRANNLQKLKDKEQQADDEYDILFDELYRFEKSLREIPSVLKQKISEAIEYKEKEAIEKVNQAKTELETGEKSRANNLQELKNKKQQADDELSIIVKLKHDLGYYLR